MVRTRADNCARKAVAAKAPRKALGSSSSSAGPSGMTSPAGKAGKYAGGNAVCPRPTPEWQKGISGFFVNPRGKENVKPDDHEDEAMVEEGESGTSCAAASSCDGSSSQTSSSGDSGSSSPRQKRNNLIDSDSEDE